jgi:hypothetical protein
MGQHSTAEYRLIMTVLAAVCLIGAASAVLPAVELVAGIGVGVLLGLLALAGLAYVAREIRRELLFRAEMRALDRRDAARRNPGIPPAFPAVGGGR